MSTSSRYWADCTTHEFAQWRASAQLQRTIAVLPLAATEQHGPHLPCSVDAVLLNGIVEAALPHLGPDLHVLFLPLQPLGLSQEHARFAGTLTLTPETVLRLWTEIGQCVAQAGVRKLLLLNSHGGNVALMETVARDLRSRLDLLVYSASWFNLPLLDANGQDLQARYSAEELRFGIHGGAMETSMMLALDAQHVDMGQARHFVSSAQDRAQHFEVLGNGRSARLAWQMQDYNPAGAAGDACAASASEGHALVDAAARGLARLLVEFDRLPLSTLVPCPAA